jgi:hypothetical protein
MFPLLLPSHIKNLYLAFILWLKILELDADYDFQQSQILASLFREIFPYHPYNNCENPIWNLITMVGVFI